MGYVPLALATMFALLWLLVLAPLFLRSFGVRLPISFRKRQDLLRQTCFARYACLHGLMSCGLAVIILTVGNAYFQWRLSAALWTSSYSPGLFQSGWRLLIAVAAGGAIGLFYSWITWGGTFKQSTLS